MTTVRIDIDGQMSPNETRAVQPTMPAALIGHMSETDWKAWVDSVDVGLAPLNEISKYLPYWKWFALPGLVMFLLVCWGLMPGSWLRTCEETHPDICTINITLTIILLVPGPALLVGFRIVLGTMFKQRAFACLDTVKKICEEESQKHANMTFIVKEDVQQFVTGKHRHMVRFMYVEVSVIGAAVTSPVPTTVQAEVWQVPGAVDAKPPEETEDVPEKMEKLKKMLQSGLINEEDYEKKKAELLEKM